MSFLHTVEYLNSGIIDSAVAKIETLSEQDVLKALERIPVTPEGFMALLSRQADALTSDIEILARELTAQRFGRVVNLYIPLYLTNSCINNCLYCGFGSKREVQRKTLTLNEIALECQRLLQEGYKSLLLVAGEDKRWAPVKYIESAIKLAKKLGFVFVAIEAGPMTEEEYRVLCNAGLDGVTVYQETYEIETYRKVHPSGPKKDYKYRLDTPERAARAGVRSVGIGFLLGLADFRKESLFLGAHIKYLRKKYWQTSIAVSFPRIHETPSGFSPAHPVSDSELVQIILAVRLANPDAVLTLSTREASALRDRLFGAGINQVSAGSKTSPGAYIVDPAGNQAAKQFPVVDDRTPAEVIDAIRKRGLEWVFKDWDLNLRPVS